MMSLAARKLDSVCCMSHLRAGSSSTMLIVAFVKI